MTEEKVIKIIPCSECEHYELKSYGIRVCKLRNECIADDDNCLIAETQLRAWYGRCERLNEYEFPANKILEESA